MNYETRTLMQKLAAQPPRIGKAPVRLDFAGPVEEALVKAPVLGRMIAPGAANDVVRGTRNYYPVNRAYKDAMALARANNIIAGKSYDNDIDRARALWTSEQQLQGLGFRGMGGRNLPRTASENGAYIDEFPHRLENENPGASDYMRANRFGVHPEAAMKTLAGAGAGIAAGAGAYYYGKNQGRKEAEKGK